MPHQSGRDVFTAAEFCAAIDDFKRSGNRERMLAWLDLARARIQMDRLSGHTNGDVIEGLAFCTPDDEEAVRLYRELLSLASRTNQSSYNHRMLLAERLVNGGHLTEARRQLILARAEAAQGGDHDGLSRADAALARVAV